MPLEPEIGVRQNMIQVPPPPPGGITETVAAPFRGCMTVLAFILLGIGYCGYKVAHWTHEVAVERRGNKIVAIAKKVLSTDPIGIVVRESLFEGYPDYGQNRDYDDLPSIEVLRTFKPDSGEKSLSYVVRSVREELVKLHPGTPTSYLIRQVSESLNAVYDADYKIVGYEHNSYINHYQRLFVFVGADAYQQINQWLAKKNKDAFKPLDEVESLRVEPSDRVLSHNNVEVTGYYKFDGKLFFDTDCEQFGELSNDDVTYLSHLSIK